MQLGPSKHVKQMLCNMLRRHKLGMSLCVTVTIVCLTYGLTSPYFEFTGKKQLVAIRELTDNTTHVNVLLRPGVMSNDQMLTETLKQAHQQLGDKRDLVERLEFGNWSKRADQLSMACSALKVLKDETYTAVQAAKHLSYYKKTGVLYCPAAKVASKFWARTLHVLETDKYISPFQFAHGDHKTQWSVKQTEGMSEKDRSNYVKDIMNSTYTFMFTRDPYKRIFSSYVDKFVNPNSHYWGFGRSIIAFARQSNKSVKCGHDLKFSELVKFLLARDPAKYDAHFKPVSTHCDVCNIKYDFVGKVETFKKDVMIVFNKTHASETRIVFKDFGQENSIHYILLNTIQAFQFMSRSVECVTVHDVHMRLWRMLQISGLIEKQFSYPLTPDESSQANITTITNLLLNAYHRSSSTARSNTKEARQQAYSEISLEDMEKLRLKYLSDLMLFDYEDRPDELFAMDESRQQRGGFDFFDYLSRVP